MTTKQELQEGHEKEIKRLELELKQLQEELPKFKEEENLEIKRKQDLKVLERQMVILEKKFYDNNFKSRDNYYYSRIPDEYEYLLKCKDDRPHLIDALKEIFQERKKEVISYPEYIELEIKLKNLTFSNFSEEYRELLSNIEDTKRDIEWNQNWIRRLEDRGELIKRCKYLKEREIYEESQRIQKEKIAKFKELIIKENNKESH